MMQRRKRKFKTHVLLFRDGKVSRLKPLKLKGRKRKTKGKKQ